MKYTLSVDEYNALSKIIRGCRLDCWAITAQTPDGNDYIYDIEYGARYPLRSGISLLLEGVGCPENLGYCNLSHAEMEALKALVSKLEIPNDIF